MKIPIPRIPLFIYILILSWAASSCNHPEDARPNIILILADDLGWKDLSFNGSNFYETPNIDRLAGKGYFFPHAYSNAPICAPSRAALLSGQYAPRTGFYTNHQPERGETSWRALIPTPNHHALDLDKITLAEVLKQNGYRTMHAGKWHVCDDPDLYPEHQGFDINIAGHRAGKPKTYFSPYMLPNLEDGPPGEYLTDRLTTEAISFMEEQDEAPFFVYLAHYAPHTPLQAKDSLIQKYMAKTPDNGQFDSVYAAMIESLDQSVGSLIESLERTGQSDNTILIFFSDNGTAPFVAPEEPFRGYKGTLYEGGIRVPLIIQLPQDEGGKTIDTPVIGTDLYPTILDLAGIEKPEDYPMDGVSLKPLFEHSDEFQQRALFWHFPAYLQGEYGMTEIWRTTPVSAVREGNFKLLEFHEDGHKELYNLKDDPAETINLVQTEQAIAERLINLLDQWRLTYGVPFPLEKNPEYDAASIPEYYKSEERSAVYRPGFK